MACLTPYANPPTTFSTSQYKKVYKSYLIDLKTHAADRLLHDTHRKLLARLGTGQNLVTNVDNPDTGQLYILQTFGNACTGERRVGQVRPHYDDALDK